jgi:hypothetical protein
MLNLVVSEVLPLGLKRCNSKTFPIQISVPQSKIWICKAKILFIENKKIRFSQKLPECG